MSTDASAFPPESTTAEPTTVTVTYDKINQTINSGGAPTDTGKTWPVYRTATNNIQAMSLQDIKDTFLHPAIDLLVSASLGTDQGGTYHINTSNNVSGSTLVSGTPIFVNTQADTTAYSPGTIGDHALDNPTTIQNYYFQRNIFWAFQLEFPILKLSHYLNQINQIRFLMLPSKLDSQGVAA